MDKHKEISFQFHLPFQIVNLLVYRKFNQPSDFIAILNTRVKKSHPHRTTTIRIIRGFALFKRDCSVINVCFLQSKSAVFPPIPIVVIIIICDGNSNSISPEV